MPDGSWEGARALVSEFARRAVKVRYVALDAARVASHDSPLLGALHPGAGRGRLSTLEAVAMMLAEAAEAEAGETAQRALAPLVEYARGLAGESGGDEDEAPPARWVAALEGAARAGAPHACPPGLRRC